MVSTVEAFSDMSPCPRARVDIDDAELHPSCVTVTVLQTSMWGEVPVNNQPRPVAGGLVVEDYTIPPGVQVVYRVRQYDAAGTDLGYALSLSAMVEVPFGRAVIQDPFAPRDAVILDAEADFASRLSRSRPTQMAQSGGHVSPLTGLPSLFQSMNLSCYTDTVSDKDLLARILEQPIVLVRAHPRTSIPGAVHVTIPNPVPDTSGHARFGRDTTLWSLSGSQVSRPAIDVLVPVFSYDLFKAYLDAKYPPFGTYDDAAAEWSTYIDAIRNPPPLV